MLPMYNMNPIKKINPINVIKPCYIQNVCLCSLYLYLYNLHVYKSIKLINIDKILLYPTFAVLRKIPNKLNLFIVFSLKFLFAFNVY